MLTNASLETKRNLNRKLTIKEIVFKILTCTLHFDLEHSNGCDGINASKVDGIR